MAGSKSITTAGPASPLELDGFGGLDVGVQEEEEEAKKKPQDTTDIAAGQYGGKNSGRCSISGNVSRVNVRFGALCSHQVLDDIGYGLFVFVFFPCTTGRLLIPGNAPFHRELCQANFVSSTVRFRFVENCFVFLD